jgi:hypothetical protein
MAYPSIGKIDLAFFDAGESGSASTGQLAQAPVTTASSSALTRLRLVERKKVAYAAGGLALLLVALLAWPSRHPKPAPLATPVAVAAPGAPPPVAAPPPVEVPAPEPIAAQAPADDEAEAPDVDKEAASRRGGKGRRGAAAPSAAASKKLLKEGERLLHAEKFPEARSVFEKLTQSKYDRGPALVGLAEVSFQEKNYVQAVKSAQLAADRGGGARARVLQGDANYRLNHFKEAAKAYQDALKLDPTNASAQSGLALANKRM